MYIRFISIISISVLFFLNCTERQSKPSGSGSNIDEGSSSEYIASDTISQNREPFDIDSFRVLQENARIKNETNALVQVKDDKKEVVKKLPKKSPKYYSKIKFEQDVYTIGDITEGDIIDQKFEFTNIGKAPLNINKAEGTCGCTVPSYPFLSVAPGETGVIGVTYNSVGKSGLQEPEILVYSDAINSKISKLKLVINVLDKDQGNPVDSTESLN